MLAGAGRVLLRNRTRAAIAAAAVAIGLTTVVAVSHAATAAAGLLKVRLGGDAQQTRLVMDIDQAASGKLISDGSADGHLILVMPTVSAQGGLQGSSQGLVKAWTIQQTSAGARLQMDLADNARIKGRFLLPPADGIDHYRYVVDIVAQPGAVRLVSTTTAPTPVALKLRPQIPPARALPVSLKK